MTAAVYVVGGSNRTHEELRYSLRSLANAPDVTDVWIVGQAPHWVTGVKRIDLEPLPEKFANQRQSMTAFVTRKGAPRQFYLFNEDFYIMDPVEGRLPTFHLGDALDYVEHVWRPKNTWCHAVRNTAEWVNARLGSRCLVYEAHTPLRFDRHKLAGLLAEYPADRSVSLSVLYPLAGAGGVGVNAGNAKVGADDALVSKLSQAMPYLSGNQASFDGALGDLLRERFPEPCRWEA